MIWYYYLAYTIYKFYRRRDKMPIFFSFLATTLLLTINVESIAGSIHLLRPYLSDNSKYYALLLMIVIAIINYFLLYRNKYYEVIFDNFDLHKEKYKKWNMSTKVYITVSVLILLVTLVLADLRNHGHL